MGSIRVSQELGLLFDPIKGVVAEQRADVLQYGLDALYPKVERLDRIADDMMNQLVPDNELMESYGNRGKASYIAGLYTNIWQGFIIGLVVAFVILVASLFGSDEGIQLIQKAVDSTAPLFTGGA